MDTTVRTWGECTEQLHAIDLSCDSRNFYDFVIFLEDINKEADRIHRRSSNWAVAVVLCDWKRRNVNDILAHRWIPRHNTRWHARRLPVVQSLNVRHISHFMVVKIALFIEWYSPDLRCHWISLLSLFSLLLTLFRYKEVFVNPITDKDVKPELLDLPSTNTTTDATEEEETPQSISIDQSATYKSRAQLSDDLFTLSSLPRSKWMNLSNLQQIRLRNKPKEPVQVPKNAPFFLPTVASTHRTCCVISL